MIGTPKMTGRPSSSGTPVPTRRHRQLAILALASLCGLAVASACAHGDADDDDPADTVDSGPIDDTDGRVKADASVDRRAPSRDADPADDAEIDDATVDARADARDATASDTGPRDSAPSTDASITLTWSTNGVAYRQFRNQRFQMVCPPNGTAARIWGSTIYSDDSSICTAAVHYGQITLQSGGAIGFEPRIGENIYRAVLSNGIQSESYGPWQGSFVIYPPGDN
jgi:hypothetical protein